MTSLLFAILTAIHLFLTVVILRRAWADRSWYLVLLALVTLGLVYDNGMVAIGRFIGAGPLLETLNVPRFVVHALVTPLLVIVGFGFARRSGAAWAQKKWVHAAFCAFAAVLIGWGVVTELIGLELELGGEGDAVSYSAVDPSFPVPSVAVIVVLIGIGIAIIKRGGVWMLAGSAAMFVAAAIRSLPLVVANAGEVALIVGLVLTGMLPVPDKRKST